MLDCYAILNEAYDNIKTIKKIDNGQCKKCNKKIKPIKNDCKRDYCKKCYFELEEDRKFKEFFKKN